MGSGRRGAGKEARRKVIAVIKDGDGGARAAVLAMEREGGTECDIVCT